jgi:GNAT superfamily N-acetyltransferase
MELRMAAERYQIPDTLVTTYLHMTRRDQFRPAYVELPGVHIMPMGAPDVNFYRFLYRSVGEHLRWRDRLIMSEAELEAALAKPGTTVNVMYVGGIPAGYVELANNGTETELAYFGLRPAYHGLGLGKHLLSYGIEQAWMKNIQRLWVHTCNLDSPHALENYVKRGFEIYDVHHQPMPHRYI